MSEMAEERPTAAFTLILIGLVVQVVIALYVVYVVFIFSSVGWGWIGIPHMMPAIIMGWFWPMGFAWFVLSLLVAVIALGVWGLLWVYTTDPMKVRTGGALALAAAILAFPTMFGFLVGSLIMLIGAVLALSWQPSRG